MKKLSIIVAGLMASAMLFAQSNESKVEQNSIDGAVQNKAVVNQTGQENKSDVLQEIEEGNASGLNQTNVKQEGKMNTADVDQTMEIWGGSPANKVDVNQKGQGNAANVKSQAYWGHDVDVIQDGKSNVATVDVERNGNKTLVKQVGGNVGGRADQIVTAKGAVVTIEQISGKSNQAKQTVGTPDFIGSNVLYIKQFEGNSNMAEQTVNGTEAGAASGNRGDIYQSQGMGNSATQIFDVIGADKSNPYGNYAKTTQTGGTGNTAITKQRHSNNEAYQTQVDGGNNYAEIGQKLGWT
ncbi:MAG: hypothetical protein ACOCVN_02445, partial [bacterium]